MKRDPIPNYQVKLILIHGDPSQSFLDIKYSMWFYPSLLLVALCSFPKAALVAGQVSPLSHPTLWVISDAPSPKRNSGDLNSCLGVPTH